MILSRQTAVDCKKKPNNETAKHDRKPLRSVSIYLDIINCNQTTQKLTKEIIDLGGNVETFLNKNVKYFVTNRRSCKTTKSASCESSVIDTSSSRNSACISSTLTPNSPWKCETPAIKIINRGVKSRADTLLERANKTVKMAEDVLQMASSLGVKIIPVQQFLIWLKKLKLKGATNETSTKKESSKLKLSGTSSKTRLFSPFFKYEDAEGNYCPQYRQLQQWPVLDLNQQHEQSPFKKIFNKSFKGLNFKMSPKKHNQNPKMFKISKGLCSIKDDSVSFGNKSGYCDVCSVRYKNLFKHLEDKKHQEIVTKPTFYTKLDQYISFLPTLSQLQNRYKYQAKENSVPRIDAKKPTACDNSVAENTENICESAKLLCITTENTVPLPKKLKVENFKSAFNVERSQNSSNDKENANEAKISTDSAIRCMKTPEKQFHVKRNALNHLRNVAFCNVDNLSKETLTKDYANAEDEEMSCVLKSTPVRLLRSTSQRRSLSYTSSGSSSSNSQVASQSAFTTPTATMLNYDEDNAVDNSLYNDLGSVDLSMSLKLSLNEAKESIGEGMALDQKELTLPQEPVKKPSEEMCPQLQPEAENIEFEELYKNIEAHCLTYEPDDVNWDCAIDSFILNKVRSALSDIESVHSSSFNTNFNCSPAF